jgi:hypothetical protein
MTKLQDYARGVISFLSEVRGLAPADLDAETVADVSS